MTRTGEQLDVNAMSYQQKMQAIADGKLMPAPPFDIDDDVSVEVATGIVELIPVPSARTGDGEVTAFDRSFRNRASREIADDDAIAAELTAAGIGHTRLEALRGSGEVKTAVFGELHGWSFKRAWTYWIAEGPGIEIAAAERLHAAHGRSVRVAGHCGCPSPREWYKGLAVGDYHVDTPAGLKALADTIKSLVNVPPTTSRDEPGDGESEAGFEADLAEAINKARYTPDGLPYRTLQDSFTGDREYCGRLARGVMQLLAERRAVATNAEPVGWQWRRPGQSDLHWMINEGGCKPDEDQIKAWNLEIAPIYAYPPRDPEPEGDGWRDEALFWLLKVIEGAGGSTDASDYAGHPLNVFCNDREPDTFNLAINRKLTRTTHNDLHETSTVYITDAGREYLKRPLPPAPTLKQEGGRS